MYDLVVVGAGPVGSFLSWKFSEKGNRVLLLERDVVGEPLKCTGHISKELFNFIPYNEDIIQNEIERGVFHNNGKSYVFGDGKIQSYVVDRTGMDRFIAEKAVESGVELKNERFEGLRRGDDEILVMTDEGTYQTRMVAGCDGPMSDVRRSVNLPEPGMFLQGIFTKRRGVENKREVDIYLEASEDFFGWEVPENEKTEYGLATSLGKNARDMLERFSRSQNFEVKEIHSGLIPLLPPRRTVTRGIFLCGDAAAQVKPFTGGGVIYGLTSALIASRVIDPKRPETSKLYEKAWRHKLGREIFLGNQIRKIYSLPSSIRKMFLGLGERISGNSQMDRPSTLFRLP
ncbi:MAG: geranylgeranyl reductase family protein [Candidatus Aenigmatarchaeota archaeon]